MNVSLSMHVFMYVYEGEGEEGDWMLMTNLRMLIILVFLMSDVFA